MLFFFQPRPWPETTDINFELSHRPLLVCRHLQPRARRDAQRAVVEQLPGEEMGSLKYLKTDGVAIVK